jgi:hypothetical protein
MTALTCNSAKAQATGYHYDVSLTRLLDVGLEVQPAP